MLQHTGAGQSFRPGARALYPFPTKSLGQDQLEAVLDFGLPVTAGIYDGDTANGQKVYLRENAGIIITNPDMLHRGILANHLKWHRFFSNLKFVVIDELHNYRGVFGTHISHLVRRLRRICRHYGSDPVFILCSATIANPADHAARLIRLSGARYPPRYAVLHGIPARGRACFLRAG